MFISVLQISQLLLIWPAETKEVVAFLGPGDGSAGSSEIIRFTDSGKIFSMWFNWTINWRNWVSRSYSVQCIPTSLSPGVRDSIRILRRSCWQTRSQHHRLWGLRPSEQSLGEMFRPDWEPSAVGSVSTTENVINLFQSSKCSFWIFGPGLLCNNPSKRR